MLTPGVNSVSFELEFDQKYNTNIGDQHCDLSHFYKLDVSYANAKTHNVYHWCLCFIFDQNTMALELQSSVTNKICHQRKQNKQKGTFKIMLTCVI